MMRAPLPTETQRAVRTASAAQIANSSMEPLSGVGAFVGSSRGLLLDALGEFGEESSESCRSREVGQS